eukprot:165780-Pelagomonas_calceolata.AAC.4
MALTWCMAAAEYMALEDAAVGVTIKVPLLNKEEDLAVALLNIISCIRQLAVEGATRELRMMAPVQLILGKRHSCIGQLAVEGATRELRMMAPVQ